MWERIEQSLQVMLDNWKRMQSSDMDDAGDDAERFEQSFYQFTENVSEWLSILVERPKNLEEAMRLPELQTIMECLPSPLQLNFAMEIEDVCDAREKIEDDA